MIFSPLQILTIIFSEAFACIMKERFFGEETPVFMRVLEASYRGSDCLPPFNNIKIGLLRILSASVNLVPAPPTPDCALKLISTPTTVIINTTFRNTSWIASCPKRLTLQPNAI